MKLNAAKIVWNPKKPKAKIIAREVGRFLSARGIRVVAQPSKADLLIIVGGDGTLLYNKGFFRLPIFAIGSRRSFICQATAENWKKKLGRIINKGFTVEKRMMLACEVSGKVLENALNEVVIRSRNHRVIDMHLQIGRRRADFLADGVLFSTPTGSSAYCYSCGGKELPKNAGKYAVVAIAPYRRAFKPTVVSDSAECSAYTESNSADLVFDGQFIHKIRPRAKVRIRKSKRFTELVRA